MEIHLVIHQDRTRQERQTYAMVQNKPYRYNEKEITHTLVTMLYELSSTEVDKRNHETTKNKIMNILHKASRSTMLYANHKRKAHNFSYIKYNEKEIRINVASQKNDHTTKYSFPNEEEIAHQDTNRREKIKSEIFRTEERTIVYADLNARNRIMKGTIPKAFPGAIESIRLYPRSLSISYSITLKGR